MMRTTFGLIALGGAATAGAWSTSDSLAVAEGLAEGFVFDGTVKECLKNSKVEIKDIEKAVKDFEKKDATDVLEGLRQLADGLKALPPALKECKASEEAVKNLVDALEQIYSPKKFLFHVGKNLVVNHHDIFEEIKTAVDDFKQKKFEDFGVQVGEALRKLIIGIEGRFLEFITKHNKTYATDEERNHRLNVFAQNHKEIYRLQRAEHGSAVYTYLSPFADLSPEEFSARNGFKFSPNAALEFPQAELLDTSNLPDNFDWRTKGAVNPVKNQAQCGSCWAFATVANIEGAGFAETGKLVSLSEQELVDCDKSTGDQGCKGGLPSNAYKDMIAKKLGLETEAAYPYSASDGQCKSVASKEAAFISAWQQISTDEDQIAAAVVKYGPLAIGINAGPMQWYGGGIANPLKFLCNPKSIDHGVAIVGFGVESGKKYWIIRNSWGPGWGEKGYYRIIRGTGACGLNSMVTTATGIKIQSGESTEVVV